MRASCLTHLETQVEAEGGHLVLAGNVIAGNGEGFGTGSGAEWTGADLESWINGQPNNITDEAPTFISLEWGDPDIRPAPMSNVIDNGVDLPPVFEPTHYAGAVDPNGENWTRAAWTRYGP